MAKILKGPHNSQINQATLVHLMPDDMTMNPTPPPQYPLSLQGVGGGQGCTPRGRCKWRMLSALGRTLRNFPTPVKSRNQLYTYRLPNF
nr:diptericin A-like [Drosophila suzukii]